MGRTLQGITTAILLGVSALAFPFRSHPAERIIYDKTFPVEMRQSGSVKVEQENFRVLATIDDETDTIYLKTYTQDYNRKNWIGSGKEETFITERHTGINQIYSRVFALYPKRVDIEEIKQKVYLVPDYRWSIDLESYDENEPAQFIVESAERKVDSTLSKIFSFISLRRIYDKFIEHSEKEAKKYYERIFEWINKDYAYTQILPDIPKRMIGYTETAREYAIQFDPSSNEKIPLYLWMKIALGNKSTSEDTFPNRYGELENILIQFYLNENEEPRGPVETYLFHRDELDSINLSSKNPERTNENPAFIDIKTLTREDQELYLEDKVLKIWLARYVMLEKEEYSKEKDLSLEIVEFESKRAREDFMKKRREDLTYPVFLGGSMMAFIKPQIKEVIDLLGEFSEQQISAYAKLILDYSDRTGMEFQLDEDEIRDRELLDYIKSLP